MMELKIPPPIIALMCALLMFGIARAVPAGAVAVAVAPVISVALALAGVTLALAGVIAFNRSQTTIHPLHPEKTSALVTSGIYNRTRNPMYLGMVLVLAGVAVYLGNALALVGLPLFVATITRLQIIPEEQILRAKFGAEFDTYTERVRRWI
jgi:protein-S-isoprenylcysteine O-methyltransferase Ste14